MPRNLRRSRRGAAPAKKTSAYNVDDIVEIVRGNATVKARLARLLSEASSPNPLWLIKFDGLSLKDEEIREHVFDRRPSNHDSDNSMSDQEGYSNYRRNNGYGSDLDRRSQQHYNSDDSDNHHNGEGNSKTRNKRALAREARSRRRQAKIDSSPPPPPVGGKRRIPPPPRNKGGKRPRHHSNVTRKMGNNNNHNGNNGHGAGGGGGDNEEEEVVEMKLLTGTLYSFKGRHGRRVEFIRRV